ncbi:S-layer homology domain-containing protein [Spirulina sp. CS-785/01]|uniref:S-layer homology domain-containing protein n=1 Tax=Spirulina sp. CS-785/01 TaxID=3021716 RepID=UPI00232D85DC|nr:S-layer homology domain-containing protein [Spirulina sp. CS-785/01]MDB9312160.1 S-layer homology domain-containing protein [Spirulina sp. CS-785/01]
MATFYINPTTGSDRAAGTRQAPWQTLTYALSQATANTLIYLAQGTYDTSSGEKFPFLVPVGVTIIGDEPSKGRNIILSGGGDYQSPTFRRQNITLLASDRTQLRGITLTNPKTKGIGLWIESASPILANLTVHHCTLAGIVVTGTSKPIIRDSHLAHNGSTGLFLRRNAKGEMRRNLCQDTGYGITVSDESAPLLSDNRLLTNRAGIYLSHQAKPVIRRNLIEKNKVTGIVLKENAQPYLGSPQDPALNIIRDNEHIDLQHEGAQLLTLAGNELNQRRVRGNVEFAQTDLPLGSTGPSQFPDIQGHWATDFIDELVKRGLIRGFPDGTFKPDHPLTRAEYAVLVSHTFDLPRQLGTQRVFRDVSDGFWAAEVIRKAADMGFIAGYGDGTFRPQENISRGQVLVSLVNGLGLTGGSMAGLQLFRDRAQIPSYATTAIAIATEKQLVVNHPHLNQLQPLQDTTRAEITAFLYQALVATGKARPLPSAYIVDPSPVLPTFTDIQNHWAKEFIIRLAHADLVSGFGNGTFQPDAPINRAQYAALLVKVFNPPPIRPASQFLDVPTYFWGHGAILQAYRAGFISGFPDRTFHPEQKLRRIHLIISLANGLSLPESDPSVLRVYEDQWDIPTYAQNAVAAATKANIIVNHPNPQQLDPKADATRAEAVAMAYQALVYQGKMSPLALISKQ